MVIYHGNLYTSVFVAIAYHCCLEDTQQETADFQGSTSITLGDNAEKKKENRQV